MKDPDKPIKELMESADYSLSHYGEVIVLIGVNEDAFEEGKKPEIIKKLLQYGTLTKDNPKWSHLISLRPHNIGSLEKLAKDHYKNGKIPGVRALEIDSKSVVYCGQTLDSCLYK